MELIIVGTDDKCSVQRAALAVEGTLQDSLCLGSQQGVVAPSKALSDNFSTTTHRKQWSVGRKANRTEAGAPGGISPLKASLAKEWISWRVPSSSCIVQRSRPSRITSICFAVSRRLAVVFMRTFRPKIKREGKDKSLEWIWNHLSNIQKSSLKNLYDLRDGELMETIRYAKKPNKAIWEACRLLRVRLKRNAFDCNRRKSPKKGGGPSGESKNPRNGYGRFSKHFGKLG